MKLANNFIFAALFEIPGLAIQTGAIIALVHLTYGNPLQALFATILGILWLKFYQRADSLHEDVQELRAKRSLFIKLGRWLGRDDAAEAFDQAYSGYLDPEFPIGDELYTSVGRASAISKFWRSILSVLLHSYLLLPLWQVIAG